MNIKLILPTITAVVLFLLVGYVFSDDYFFEELITEESINTPEKALEYVCKTTSYAKEKPVPGLSPRYLLTERKNLYCDEGAVLLATIVHELGFETRLVDLANVDSTSRHTILEVYQDEKWVTYDTVQNLRGASYHEVIEGYESEFWRHRNNVMPKDYKICRNETNHLGLLPKYRKYPKIYNWFVQNNYFIKQFVLWLRGIPG